MRSQPVPAPHWHACLSRQREGFFDALFFKKHPASCHERLLAAPPWGNYAIVSLTLASVVLFAADVDGSAVVGMLLAGAGVLRLAWRRLAGGAATPERIVHAVATSALIPFLSVYWRLRGAIHFRVLFL